ncbi:hypothetical protein FOA52_000316 [Chlamydomonas sp. UWO 241]|nr:hypothetical protein FOA52_000316 [Chlamydomonas sp. UWO 241]
MQSSRTSSGWPSSNGSTKCGPSHNAFITLLMCAFCASLGCASIATRANRRSRGVQEDVPVGERSNRLTPRATAASVSPSSLRSLFASEAVAGLKPFHQAIVGAMADRSNCAVGAVMDQAMVNVGAIYAKQVDGRVCTDVDAHLANDEAAMVAKVSALARLYSAAGVPASKTIYRLPATWAGIQAAKQLEAKGISTQVYLVFSMIQAVAAAQAGVSVIQPNVGRIRECFVKFPNASHDFGVGGEGPAHFIDPSDAGIKLVQQISAYVHKHHPSKTAVMASGVRTKDDALRLSGVNYMILPSRVIAELSATPTTTGYNDGWCFCEDDFVMML